MNMDIACIGASGKKALSAHQEACLLTSRLISPEVANNHNLGLSLFLGGGD